MIEKLGGLLHNLKMNELPFAFINEFGGVYSVSSNQTDDTGTIIAWLVLVTIQIRDLGFEVTKEIISDDKSFGIVCFIEKDDDDCA